MEAGASAEMASRTGLRQPPNRLLAKANRDDARGLALHLEDVTLGHKEVLYEPDQPIDHVYFPSGSVVSLVTVMRDGQGVETGVIGYEGMVGTPIVMGVGSMHNRAICQVPGPAKCMPAAALMEQIEQTPRLRLLMTRYIQAQTIQFTQGLACNRMHTVDQRCARWLLMTHDRVAGDSFPMTQEFLSEMLAVRRASVTEAAYALQKAGIITYHQRTVTVLDRAGLEAAACECYGVIVTEFQRLLGTA